MAVEMSGVVMRMMVVVPVTMNFMTMLRICEGYDAKGDQARHDDVMVMVRLLLILVTLVSTSE